MQVLDGNAVSCPQRPERVLQFGEGNFLRAFIDWMVHRMNQAGVFNGGIVVVKPRAGGPGVDLLNAQDGLYTLYLRGIEHGTVVNRHEVITALSRGIDPYRDWRAYLETARNPDLRFVVSNTTEAGIAYVPTERPVHAAVASFPAKLTAWLAERYAAFGGSAESGMVLLPCELIDRNGTRLRECILKHAADWSLGDAFADWIKIRCIFLNTLVDRIVPGFPRDEAAAMFTELGYEDRLLCTAEMYHLLVIEGDGALKAELPFHAAGLNVVWCDDLQPYRTRKVGVLNGAHTAGVLAAFLCGLDTVRAMMDDADLGPFVEAAVFEEIIPALQIDRSDAESYAAAVMERFRNPFIHHELLSISLNSVPKWKVRVLPTVRNHIELLQKVPHRLAFSLAALIVFYRGGLRDGHIVSDDPEILHFFTEAWQSGDLDLVVDRVLIHAEFWGEDLTKLPGFETAVADSLRRIMKDGMRAAVRSLER